jgi:non-ribosomal peptide synthetase component F
MSDDLVKRLIADELPNDGQWEKEGRMVLHLLLKEAADRIEHLEAALREIETLELDPRNSRQTWVEALRQIARKALEGRNDFAT